MIAYVGWRIEYDKLWLRFGNNTLSFEDALEVIFGGKKFSIKQVKYASKLLNYIEDNAYAISFRAGHDQREKIYRLLNPDRVSNARAIYSELLQNKGFSSIDITKVAFELAKWDFMFIKDSAIEFWTKKYRSVDVEHISVFENDLDGWISLLKLCKYSIIVKNISISGEGRAIYLYKNLDMIKEQRKEHYQMPHHTVIDCLRSDFSGALAVMVVQKNKIDWNMLIELAHSHGLINTLGFSLEAINKKAKKLIFPKKIIPKIEKKKKKEYEIIEGIVKDGGKEYWTDMEYSDLESKWHVRFYQPDTISKIVEDLVR